MEKYNHQEIEKKWQKKWQDWELYKTEEGSDVKKKFILDMFPYPSGAGLHVGHVESYTATDIYSRFLRMNGFNVMHPQGFDAFGLPAENYAIKTGVHPSETTKQAIATFKSQMNSLGFSYDWEREVVSSQKEYYKWTQWMFLKLYENGLAYKKKAKVNWCDSCQTVLANEQAEGGKCERCGNEVVQKDLEQWFFKITDFIEDQMVDGKSLKGLINGLDDVDWPESTKAAQKNWIGKSEGAEVDFRIKNSELKISVFTTRPDTLFGATYMVLAPEHELVKNLEAPARNATHSVAGGQIENLDEVQKYINETKKKTDLERTELNKEKTGVEIKGVKAVNPVNGEDLPVFIADYVLSTYGTGAIMAVPAHDERDFEFAKKYNLPIKQVVEAIGQKDSSVIEDKASCEDGVAINSDFLNDLETSEAKKKMIEWLEKEDKGKRRINYKIRDWLVSRQRYWGAPIPIIYCEKCGQVAVSEKDLPVELPTDVDFKPTGESPLVYSKTFHDVTCPKCGAPARRESDTMDTFVCSSWYYLRYADPHNAEEFASVAQLKKWLPVDVYVGGAEHTVLHLLYSRFFTKFLQKFGFVDFNEPFSKLRHQGIILAEDGTKMSKSKGNVINPDDVVKEYGADALRMYEMFMGPLEDMKPWSTKGIIGIVRFLEKVWNLSSRVQTDNSNDELTRLTHKTIKKVTEDIEAFKFNTAISAMMILVNTMEKEKEPQITDYQLLITILSPFAPHLCEELWAKLDNKESIFKQPWPKYDPELARDEKIELVLQINGKVRDKLEVAADITEEEAIKLALESDKMKQWLDGKDILKKIFVKGKLVNIVVR